MLAYRHEIGEPTMNTYARIMLRLVVSMDTAPKRRAIWARLAKTQNLK
jgi:hypothetical protein